MRNIRAFNKVLVILVTVAMLPALLSVNASAAPKSNGSFIIEIFDGSTFTQLADLSCDEFQKEFEVSLNRVTNPRLRIRKAAEGLAFLDSVLLDGQAASGSKKLMKTDLDVQEITAEGIELRFDGSFGGSLSFTGRIEPEVIIGEPFMFPFENTFIDDPQELQNFFTYELGSNTRSVKVDGKYENQGKPFESRYLVPATGHPDGYAYIYVSNDAEYLYASADFTSDNTYDYGDDFFKVFVKQGNTVKEFKQTSSGNEYGAAAMQYTDKVEYEHMYYEVKIPLDQLGGTNELQLAFSLYGTSALFGMTSDPAEYTIAAGQTANGVLRLHNFWNGSTLESISCTAPGLDVQFLISSSISNEESYYLDVPYTIQGAALGDYVITITGGVLSRFINNEEIFFPFTNHVFQIPVDARRGPLPKEAAHQG
jgi:hypothetical protein